MGWKNGLAGAAGMEAEEVQLLAELAVVPLARLLQERQVFLQLLPGRERGAVDALEHLVPLVAAPVGAGHRRELEGLDQPGAGQVRAAAEVHPVSLAVERHGLVGNPGEDLDLVVLSHAAEQLDGLGLRQLLAHDGQVLPRQLAHPFLDLLDLLGRKRLVALEVVVEAVTGGGADGDLGPREQALDRLGHEVGGGVAQDVDALGAVEGDGLAPGYGYANLAHPILL